MKVKIKKKKPIKVASGLPAPKKVKCFKCKKELVVKFNRAKNEYSQKNNWGYWINREEKKNNYICNSCLIHLYKENKQEYLEAIFNSKKRELLRVYLRNGAIS